MQSNVMKIVWMHCGDVKLEGNFQLLYYEYILKNKCQKNL